MNAFQVYITESDPRKLQKTYSSIVCSWISNILKYTSAN